MLRDPGCSDCQQLTTGDCGKHAVTGSLTDQAIRDIRDFVFAGAPPLIDASEQTTDADESDIEIETTVISMAGLEQLESALAVWRAVLKGGTLSTDLQLCVVDSALCQIEVERRVIARLYGQAHR